MDAVCFPECEVNMKTLYEKVSRQLERLDFEALWPGFSLYPFALYDGEHAILDGQMMECPKDFRGNTTVVFRERQIAIWNVRLGLPEDDVRFASMLVHEMFHAFQMERGEKRFPNDFVLAGRALSPEYLAIKAEEFRCLSEEDGLPHFLALREMRRALDGGLVQEELLVETVEGMAQYVEFCALGQLCEGDRQRAALAECAKQLADPEWLLDSRRCAYDSGTLLLFAARRQGISVFHDIGGETCPVYDVIRRQLPQVPRTSQTRDPVSFCRETLDFWSGILSRRSAQRQAVIQAFLREEHTTVKGEFCICGYDPMNLWREGDILYSTSFLCLRDQDGEMVTLTGKVLLQMRSGSPDIADAYCTVMAKI